MWFIHLSELCKWFVQVCSKRKSPLSDVGDSKQKDGHFFLCEWTFWSCIITFIRAYRLFLWLFFLCSRKECVHLCHLWCQKQKTAPPTQATMQLSFCLSLFFLSFFFFTFYCLCLKKNWHSCNIKTFLNGTLFFSSLDPWKAVINNKVPQERAMINFSFWLAMTSTPPRCLR